MSDNNISAKQLAKLIGWTVEKVDGDHKRLQGEQVARITLSKAGQIREVTNGRGTEIFLEGDQIRRDQDWLYQDFSDMLSRIQDFILDTDKNTTIVSVDDVMKRRIGFQCPETDESWWVGLGTVKNSTKTLRELALTPEGRQQMASDLSQGFFPPAPKTDE